MSMRNTSPSLSVTRLGMLLAMLAGVVLAEEQLLLNPGFEEPAWQEGQPSQLPEEWFTFSSDDQYHIRISRDIAKEGDQSVRFTATGRADTFQGLSQTLDVREGSVYEFAVHVWLDREDERRGSLRGQLSVEWLNARGEEITRTWGPVWTDESSLGFWNEISLTGMAPGGAEQGVFVITQFDTGDPERPGTFHVDDAGVWELP